MTKTYPQLVAEALDARGDKDKERYHDKMKKHHCDKMPGVVADIHKALNLKEKDSVIISHAKRLNQHVAAADAHEDAARAHYHGHPDRHKKSEVAEKLSSALKD